MQLGPLKQRAVLAYLLLHAAEVVPISRLIDALWEDDPPRHGSRATADTAISCEWTRSLAKARRSGADHSEAPERQASLRGTTWSMSMREAESRVRPSYAGYQVPDTARHWSTYSPAWAGAVQSQAHTGLGMKGVDRPRGIEPLSTRPTPR
ncbi:hypothetical protein ACFC5Z_30995 [Streptomyces sp. NPDC056004]|uniref:AfsR/SARP family transcriptional regulator n=1 Tax=unclassified Streptomyces TaxID=2593676 RepID=UPI0035E2872D